MKYRVRETKEGWVPEIVRGEVLNRKTKAVLRGTPIKDLDKAKQLVADILGATRYTDLADISVVAMNQKSIHPQALPWRIGNG